MLLKVIFSFLAAMWLYRVISQMLMPPRTMPPPPPPYTPPPPPPPANNIRLRDDDGEYIDYEEIK